jgi:hypothetical protein
MDNIEIINNKKYLIISLSGENNTKMLSINKSHIVECEIVQSLSGNERYLKISLLTGKEIKFIKNQMSLETMTKIMTEIIDDSDLC